METVQHSGLGGSRVLISDDAQAFDPESLLESDTSISNQIHVPLTILTLSPPRGLQDLAVAGFFDSLSSEQAELTLEMTVLFPVALELCHLVLLKDSTSLTSLEIRTGHEESTTLKLPDFLLISVQIDPPLNSRVKIKVLFKRHEHH